MPELPEVETICRGLKPVVEGRVISRVKLYRSNLRYPFPEGFKAALEGQQIRSLSRRSKYLLIALKSDITIIIHLGMSGRVKVSPIRDHVPIEKHDHVVITLNDGVHIIYNDPRRFGFMDMFDPESPPGYLDRLGVEPLGNEFNAHNLAQKLALKKSSMKAALLDQRVVAGLGNIYVCEALHRTGITPFKIAKELVDQNGAPKAKLEDLVVTIKDVLKDAIRSGGSTLRDYQKSDGSLGYFQHHFQVYGREGEPCLKPACGGKIERVAQNGRSSFFCANCQK